MSRFLILSAAVILLNGCKPEILDNSRNAKSTTLNIVPDNRTRTDDYLAGPDMEDSTGINAIERAKKDMDTYKGIYVQKICMGCGEKAYSIEIKTVLATREFKLMYDHLSCVVLDGQTQGCYSGFVDLKMREKYGHTYLEEIESAAENLLIQNIIHHGRIININDLGNNDRPRSRSQYGDEDVREISISPDIPYKKTLGTALFADFDFIIEKNGTISNVRLSYWPNNDQANTKYKKLMVEAAIETIKQRYNSWWPGTYRNTITRVQHSLRVYFG